MTVYGLRPEDRVVNAAGDALSGEVLRFFATQADAAAQVAQVGTVTSGDDGAWTFTSSLPELWVRTASGAIYQLGVYLFAADADATFARETGAGVARFIARARAGAALKLAALGDSVLEGATGTTPGVNDALTLVRDGLAARFPAATFTTSNRAQSGATIATAAINGRAELAITDAADLYVIGFGRNDVVADGFGVPVQGYKLALAMRGLEVLIRELRRRVPTADILVMSENPASVLATDTAMRAYQAAARRVAVAYGCEWADTYGAFSALPDYSALMFDTVHPNAAGHALIASTILARLPDRPVIPVGGGRPGPDGGLSAVTEVKADTGLNGWVVRQDPGASQSGLWLNSGAGWAGSNPYVDSTPTDFAEFVFVGTEFALRLSTSAADAAVVDVAVDGATTQTNLAMSTVPSTFQPFVVLASGLTPGQHTVRVTVKSGTLRIFQCAWLAAQLAQTPSVERRLIGGRYYGSSPYTPTTNAQAAGTATAVPIYVPRTATLNQLAVDVTAAAAGATVVLGVYGADEFDQPLGLIHSPGAVDASTTGFKTLTVTGVVLTPGWYWLAALSLGGAPTLRCNLSSHHLVSTSAGSTANALGGYVKTALSALQARWDAATVAGAVPPRILARFN